MPGPFAFRPAAIAAEPLWGRLPRRPGRRYGAWQLPNMRALTRASGGGTSFITLAQQMKQRIPL